MKKTLTVPARRDRLDEVQQFVDQILDGTECTEDVRLQLQIAVEELFVNLASYAYNGEEGKAVVDCDAAEEPGSITIQFRDWGKPFDPLAKEDADITLSAEERDIGGLGIFLVKNTMDDVAYVYEDGQNVLTIRKNLKDTSGPAQSV